MLKVKEYKGNAYFEQRKDAEDHMRRFAPAGKIVEYNRGYAVQVRISGPYLNKEGNTMLNIPYVQDPSHGWAIVKRDLLPKIRLKEEDFPYSYLSPKENFIALEEDCEMPILLKALDAHQIEYNIIDRLVEDDDPDNPRNW